MHPARLPVDELIQQVRMDFLRGPGPGGQHRNKTDTAVRAVHEPTGIQVIAGERRSQDLNKRRAVSRLRIKLALVHRESVKLDETNPERGEPDDLGYRPSALWRSRRKGNKMIVSARHEDFPALLSEALDVLHQTDDDVPRTARLLGLSTSQLVRFLHVTPEALGALNERLRDRGKKPYH